MRLLIKFIRVYTPFICLIATFINAVYCVRGIWYSPAIYLLASASGSSVLVIAYMFVTSFRMCKWFKGSLVCLLLTQILGIGYTYFGIEETLYAWLVLAFSAMGITCFLMFRIFYKVTSLLTCVGRRSLKS